MMSVSRSIPLEEAVGISLLTLASASMAQSSLMRAVQVVAPSMGKANLVRDIDAPQIHTYEVRALEFLSFVCFKRPFRTVHTVPRKMHRYFGF